jgi:hypothetical protein
VNIIHSSSLAYSPAGFNKPVDTLAGKNGNTANNSGGNYPVKQANTDNAKPSSTQQIASVISRYELPNNTYNQPNNTFTQKALNAYAQNRNQLTQSQIKQSISGIDVYV